MYGFVLSLFEYIETIPTLWDATKEFVASRPDLKETMKGNALEFVSEDGGETYNRCHCGSIPLAAQAPFPLVWERGS